MKRFKEIQDNYPVVTHTRVVKLLDELSEEEAKVMLAELEDTEVEDKEPLKQPKR